MVVPVRGRWPVVRHELSRLGSVIRRLILKHKPAGCDIERPDLSSTPLARLNIHEIHFDGFVPSPAAGCLWNKPVALIGRTILRRATELKMSPVVEPDIDLASDKFAIANGTHSCVIERLPFAVRVSRAEHV